MVSKGSPNYPQSTSAAVTARMTGNKSSDTKPEVVFRSLLHRRGYRFKKNLRIETGSRRCRPDVVFPKEQVAVFIDGCFWHACPEHGRIPTGKNGEYWRTKFSRNEERDRLDSAELQKIGWKVLRFWEHEDPDQAALKTIEVLEGERSHSKNAG